MIGLSLSKCFLAMANGDVNPSTVEKIISSRTTATTPDHWEWIIRGNRARFWSRLKKPMAAEKLFRRFLADGRIVQPRLTGARLPDVHKSGMWVNSEKEIVWK